MADFELRVVPGAGDGGPMLRKWVDPAAADGRPSRIRPHPGREQLYWWMRMGSSCIVKAVVGGVEGPADSALGGRLFYPFLAEGFGPPIFTTTAGVSSVVRFTPTNPGHHVIGLRRPQGGGYLLHLDVET